MIPNSVTDIGDCAFPHCEGLTSISVDPNNLNFSSLDGVLYDKEKTKIIRFPYKRTGNFVIPNSVTNIEDSAFENCEGLTSITIPNSVANIGDSAFIYCEGLTSIDIPNSVTDIGNRAFGGCTGLTSIVIPNSVTNIGAYAFNYCFVSVDPNNLNFSSLEGVLYDKEKTKIIKVPCGKTGDFVIPNSVTSIDRYSFCHCSKLTSIVIPNSVTDIGDYAFADCSKVTSIVIPDSVTSIGEGAFVNCEGLTSIDIPDSVTNIGDGAFEDCIKLNRIHCQIKNIKDVKIGINIFIGCDLSNCILYVPTGTDNDYRHHPVFFKFKIL